ncbi:alpha/beta hydrolase [Vulgatibacter sp.]|uniref:alpha/beta hydrolase n=1 Tax=Vulgatibacter sp. TaxID=1971226 RepID=UPI003561E59B
MAQGLTVLEPMERLLREEEPTVDEVDFKSLYRKELYEVTTADGWRLVITRYRPVPQSFHQPIFGEPLLLVHGFSQNRHAWTSGQFVKNLLFFGADIHIAELRGHGLSSVEAQRRHAAETGSRLPDDLEYAWDIDSYFLYDLPAVVEGVKEASGRERIFYCGHSMGGMLGYGYAGLCDDFEGLITIGAPSELGRGFFALRLLAMAEPALGQLLDAALTAFNLERRTRHLLGKGAGASLRALRLGRWAERVAPAAIPPGSISYRFVPMDEFLRFIGGWLTPENLARYERIAPYVLNLLTNPSRVTHEDVRWLLREGGEREPRGVLEQFAKWIRRSELVCYRSGYDFRRNFGRIQVPMAIIFGDMDRLASVRSTAGIYHAAQSEYLLWRPVKGNSHVELTMGHDARQICYDIKNLIDYAAMHRRRRPSLPRIEGDGPARR